MTARRPLWTHLVQWLAESEVSLGDERLDARWHQLTGSCLAGDGCSVASLAGKGDTKEVRAAQRFLDNERVDVADLRQGLYALTLRALAERQSRSLIVAFDPTSLCFSTQPTKQGRRQVGTHAKTLGYTWLNAAAFDPHSKCLLGVLHQALRTDQGPDDQDWVDYTPDWFEPSVQVKAADNFKHQLAVYAREINAKLDPALEVTFVADGDFDDGLTLRHLQRDLWFTRHFVIRGDAQRVVQIQAVDWLPTNARRPSPQHTLAGAHDDETWTSFYLSDLLPHVPTAALRSLPLDARGRVAAPGAKPARVAELQVGALRIRLNRRSERGRRHEEVEEAVELNLVVVTERHPPEGQKGVLWLLLTDLPCETLAQQTEVAERYLVRWRIEEFFRTAKDALRLEVSRLQDPAATARWLFFMTLKAMVLDALRQDAGLPAGSPPTKEQRRQLREGPKRAEQEAEARQADPARPLPNWEQRLWMLLGLMARYGQWTGTYQGSLGNYVLLRGLPYVLSEIRWGRYAWLVAEKDVWS